MRLCHFNLKFRITWKIYKKTIIQVSAIYGKKFPHTEILSRDIIEI